MELPEREIAKRAGFRRTRTRNGLAALCRTHEVVRRPNQDCPNSTLLYRLARREPADMHRQLACSEIDALRFVVACDGILAARVEGSDIRGPVKSFTARRLEELGCVALVGGRWEATELGRAIVARMEAA